MAPIEWVVVNKENAKIIFDRLVKENKDAVIIGLTDDGYETMAINFAQIRKFIVLQREVIKKYKEYYEGSQDGSKETSKGQ
jgi:hypothetical protein